MSAVLQPLCGADWKAAAHGEEVGISVRGVVVVEEALVLHINVCERSDAEGKQVAVLLGGTEEEQHRAGWWYRAAAACRDGS